MICHNAICGINAINIIRAKFALVLPYAGKFMNPLENGQEDVRVVIGADIL